MAKVVGFMVCGPGEADRYLKGSLDEFKRLCDDALIVCNNTDKKTEDMISSYGYTWYRDDREWGKYQPQIKDTLLQNIARLQPDWIIPLDADEQFGAAFTRAELEKLMQTKALAYYFYIVNLWNDEQHYKKSISFWNIRAYKFAPQWGTRFLNRNVHCGLAPPYAYRYGRYAGHLVRHYGLMKAEDRAKKVKRYEQYDPKGNKVGIGGWYEALKDTGLGSAFEEAAVQAKVNEEVMKMNQKDKTFQAGEALEYVLLRHPKSLREFEVPKKELSHYLTQKCTIISTIKVPDASAAVVAELPVAEATVEAEQPVMTCDVCQQEFKNEAGLKRHKTVKHAADRTE